MEGIGITSISANYGETEIAMLVLTRKIDEAIRIGDDIKITVLRVKGNTVRIGIEAPREVRVVRGELDALSSTVASRHAAARTVPADLAGVHSCSSGEHAQGSAPDAPAASFNLLLNEELVSTDDDTVITTVVDSPQHSTSRLFVGKVRIDTAKAAVDGQEGGDQAAPLRAFLRSGRKLQAAG